jgi:hypothetical protein
MEGYVYAPQKDKRHLIRQLEAIIFSFEVKNRKTK